MSESDRAERVEEHKRRIWAIPSALHKIEEFRAAAGASDEDEAERQLLKCLLDSIVKSSAEQIRDDFISKWNELSGDFGGSSFAETVQKLTAQLFNTGAFSRYKRGENHRSFAPIAKIATILKLDEIAFPDLDRRMNEGLFGAFQLFRRKLNRPEISRPDFECFMHLHRDPTLYSIDDKVACQTIAERTRQSLGIEELEVDADDLNRIKEFNDDWMPMIQILDPHWQTNEGKSGGNIDES